MSDERIARGVPTLVREGQHGVSGVVTLLVIRGGAASTHPLPSTGSVSIGRAEGNDVRIDDPSVSRRHAILHLGDGGVRIEDLGSANGTKVRGSRLAANATARIAVDEPFELGAVMAIVQQRSWPVRTRRLWTHDYFEGRLADECARAERSHSEFAVVRMHCDISVPEAAVLDVLSRVLREIDIFGLYAPGEYELLLIDTSPAQIQVPLQRLGDEMRARGITVRINCAFYPRDARAPDSLLAQAQAGVTEPAEAAIDASEDLVLHEGAMQRLQKLVERIAQGMLSVLIVGETGVGKELMAATVHKLSPRADKPFLRLNCAALSESLLESELFGHERGAFTGAVQTKPGLLETADGGTVFLDELGELPMATQVKLLRVIEERQVQRVGALKPRSINVRFVAATNRDLEAEIVRGTFRQDLYFRLNGITLTIPPLRHRLSELPGLAVAFVAAACRHSGRHVPPAIAPAAMQLLKQYSWPGNIRELRNVMERATLLCGDADSITPEQLPVQKMKATFSTRMAVPPELMRAPLEVPTSIAAAEDTSPTQVLPPVDPPTEPRATTIKQELEAVERKRIEEALQSCAGNQTQAAKLLGISRRTLINRLASYEMPRPRKGRPPAR